MAPIMRPACNNNDGEMFQSVDNIKLPNITKRKKKFARYPSFTSSGTHWCEGSAFTAKISGITIQAPKAFVNMFKDWHTLRMDSGASL